MEEYSQRDTNDNSIKISKSLLRKLYFELKRLKAHQNDSSLIMQSNSNLLEQRENDDDGDDYGDDSDASDVQKNTPVNSSSSNESDSDYSERELKENSNNLFSSREIEKSIDKSISKTNALNLFKEKYNIG